MKKNTSARFNGIPRFYNGCVYVAELKNGLVKVGYSKNPRTRLQSLATQVKDIFRSEINRFYIGPDIDAASARDAEIRTLARLRGIAPQAKGVTEYFSDVGFGAVVTLASQMTRKPRTVEA